MKIGKYEFNSEKQADEKIEDLGIDTDFNGNKFPTHRHQIARLGNVILKKGKYDYDGKNIKQIEPTILSDKFHVDVIWHDIYKHPYGWKTYSVDLETEGCHKFLGVPYLENKM